MEEKDSNAENVATDPTKILQMEFLGRDHTNNKACTLTRQLDPLLRKVKQACEVSHQRQENVQIPLRKATKHPGRTMEPADLNGPQVYIRDDLQ